MSDNLSQEDIDRLLSGLPGDEGGAGGGSAGGQLNAEEKDTLGEICNIAMGTAADTLSEILSHRVELSSPNVIGFDSIEEVLSTQEDSTVVEVKYLSGLDSTVLLVLKNYDIAIIADLMMGGTGAIESVEVGDLQLTAVTEAFNQMMSSAATSLASVFNQPIDVTPPTLKPVNSGQLPVVGDDVQGVPLAGIVYKFTMGSLIDSELLQIMGAESARHQINLFMGSVDNLLQGSGASGQTFSQTGNMGEPRMFGSSENQNDNAFGSADFGQQPVTVQPARFSSFDNSQSIYGNENQNLELVLDVSLKLTVELGRSELPIKKVLELTRGSVIELDKIAGEPVDLLANGKLIAKGEVVVIEDNFGLRITSIVSPADRLKNL
jgi:flagellar motor switch protein FliN/FliY